MRTIKIEQLSLEAYQTYDTYANMINPSDEKMGEGKKSFIETSYNSMLPLRIY